MTRSIKSLPVQVQLQLKSSVALNSLNDAVIGLIENSLDGQAQKIQVEVDYHRGNCWVEDDGVGIPAEEFGELGRLGLMHRELRPALTWVMVLIFCRHLKIYDCRGESWTAWTVSGLDVRLIPSFHSLTPCFRAE